MEFCGDPVHQSTWEWCSTKPNIKYLQELEQEENEEWQPITEEADKQIRQGQPQLIATYNVFMESSKRAQGDPRLLCAHFKKLWFGESEMLSRNTKVTLLRVRLLYRQSLGCLVPWGGDHGGWIRLLLPRKDFLKPISILWKLIIKKHC